MLECCETFNVHLHTTKSVPLRRYWHEMDSFQQRLKSFKLANTSCSCCAQHPDSESHLCDKEVWIFFFSRKTGWSLSPTHVVPCVSQKVATKKNKQSAQWVKWCFCFSSLDPKMWITNRLTNATSSYLWCACCSMFSYVPLHSKDHFCHTKKHAQNNHGDHVILFTDPYLKFAFKEVTRRCVSLWFGSEDIFEEMCQSVLQKAVTSNLGPHLFPDSSSAWLKLWINLINQLNQPLPRHVSDLWNMGLIRPDWGKPGTLRGGLGWPAICFCFLFFIFLALVFEKTFESTKGLCMYFLAPLWRVDDLLFSVHG